MKLNDRQLRGLYIAVDWATTSVAWLAFNWFRFLVKPHHSESFSQFYHLPQVWGGQVFFPLLMLFIYWLSGYYNQPRMRSRAQDLLTTLGSATIGALLIFFLAVVNDFEYRRRIAIELVGVLALLLFLAVYIGRTIISWHTVLRHTEAKPLVMVGTDPSARKLAESINRQPRRMGYRVTAYADPDSDILRECEAAGTDVVVVSPAIASTDRMPQLLSRLLPADLSVLVSPGINEFRATAGRIGNVVGEPLVDLTHARVSQSTLNVKRSLDFICSLLALAVLALPMAVLAIAVKCSSPGPVFYKQKRMGRRKREFTIWKFRSMRQDAELTTGPTLTRANDPRITTVGRLMRKYRLDELPQFWNILRGDMSLVGPRPERRIFADRIAERVPLYSIIYQVRPGLTSWGMVKYGYASSVDQMVERLRYDLIYMENISLATDLKILLHTIKTVFTGRGQ